MRKIGIGIFLIGVSLFSCTNQNSNMHLCAVLQSLNLSNQHIEENNKLVYAALDERLKDPSTHSTAAKWNPKAKAIQLIVDSTINYIDQIKIELKTLSGIANDEPALFNNHDYNSVEQLFNKKKKEDEIASKMYALKNNLISALYSDEFSDGPYRNEYFIRAIAEIRKELPIGDTIIVEIDSTGPTRNQYSDYFKNTNSLEALLMLTKIQNDVLLSEHLMINFIFSQTCVLSCGISKQFLPLVVQNSTILKSGQEIEITAGVGLFSPVGNPTFTINGHITTIGDDGVAFYKLRVNQGPGKYKIPVKVEYTKPDGSSMTMTKNIEYQVVE